jgi:SAM-dependent methyltransferase
VTDPDRSLRTTFDDVAELYDEVRPGYPQQLVEDVLGLSRVPSGGRILEIGCGSGQATLPFARRGYAMLCLELGKNLAALAAAHCRPYPNVEIQNTSFEVWPVVSRGFDLVMSAGAFDWIPPEVSYRKAAEALNDAGFLALFSNHSRGADTPFFRAVGELHREIAPGLVGAAQTRSLDVLDREAVAAIDASGLFGRVMVRHYAWWATYSAESYVKLLNTYSAVRALPEGTRHHLLAGIRELVSRTGGVVETQYVSALYVARVRR